MQHGDLAPLQERLVFLLLRAWIVRKRRILHDAWAAT
jgi:hypothetical protein